MAGKVKELVFRPMDDEDIEWARALHNDPETLFQLTDAEHVNQERQRAWYESICQSKTSKRYVIGHMFDMAAIAPSAYMTTNGPADRRIGVFRIDQIDYKNANVMVGLDIASEHRGNGYSYSIYEYFFDYLFRQLNMNRVCLKVLSTNEKARHVYEKLGFIVEGFERQAVFRNGKYVDYIMMSILREEYEGDPDRHRALAKLREVSRVSSVDDSKDGE